VNGDDGGGSFEMGQRFGGRWRWLGRPAFLTCIVVLAVNDHVMKPRFPGWWTGKLSDLAGVAMLGTLLAVVLGARRGLVATGIGFVLLKAVPGVAEAAAPVLGGVTARDRGDLVALGVLVPLALALSSSGRAPAAPAGPVRRTLRRGIGVRRVSAGVSTAAPLMGALAAVVTATATSCAPDPAVTRVVGQGSVLYAFIDRDDENGTWARSIDGGQTWHHTGEPNGAGPADPSRDAGGRPRLGPPKVCGDDGTCYRLRGQRVVERRSPGGGWSEEFRLSEEEFDDVSGMCVGGDAGVLTSVAVAEGGDGFLDSGRGADDPVVASLGAGGVLVRTTDGAWQRTRVLSVPPVPATDLDRGAIWLSLVIGLMLPVGLWVVGRRRWPSWRAGLAVVAMGWAIAITATGALDFSLERSIDPLRVTGWLALGCAAITTLVALAVARRPRRVPLPPLASWTPPVPPPPPPPPLPPG
jgi:hypothetical protein